MPYVYSTSVCDTTFVDYVPVAKDSDPVIRKELFRVTIKGGHGITIPGTLDTPCGVRTKVTDEQMGFLLQNDGFKEAMAAGHFSYEMEKKIAAEKMAKNMQQTDNCSPLTPKDLNVEKTGSKGNHTFKFKKVVGEDENE